MGAALAMMKLFYATASPYARKVRVLALESGLHQQIESIVCLPLEADAIVHQINPLGRVPALVTAEGWLLVDSPVICEYLDSLRSSGLYPTGQARWRALRWQALGDGVMDSAVPWRQERIRPEAQRSPEWLQRRQTQVTSTLAYLEKELELDWNIGTLAVVCAWDYLHFRLPDQNWDSRFPRLAAWRQTFDRPSLTATAPE